MDEGVISSVTKARIAVVTGGNKGIGLEVCRQLAVNGVIIVLTARDETRGAAAVHKLKELGLYDVTFHQLDVTDASSISKLADFLRSSFGKLDILVNNAAIGGVELVGDPSFVEQLSGMTGPQRLEFKWKHLRETCDAAKECLQTNYYGVRRVTEALLPLLQSSSDGRIVNLSSDYGLLRLFKNEEVKQELNDIENLTEERLDELLETFLKDFEAGAVEERGWPTELSAYKAAKAAMNSYSRVLARRHPELRVNCVDPGFVKTDINYNSGILAPKEAGSKVVAVALLPEAGVTGALFENGKVSSFV
ncbi:hypothetical protein QOZ80_4BG0340490 [Eleusine coracana subsp. coracana]|nr:hypothetical protein QOZ80_4BG0340490 [Eleusine coracana subsp. coracana]